MNFKKFISFYKKNRLWGDSRLEAAYWAFRGKAFLSSLDGSPLENQIVQYENWGD